MFSYYIGLSFLSNKRQKPRTRKNELSAEGRRILSMLENRPVEELDVIIEENGRPFFFDRRADFSISHSGNMAAVSLVRPSAGSDLRTGCDIELVRPRANARAVAEKFFTLAERDYIFPLNGISPRTLDETTAGNSGVNLDATARFFKIWTLKESYLKLRGLSVFEMAEAPSFVSAEAGLQLAFPAPSSLSFCLYELSGHGERYVLASALEGAGQLQPEIRWFSQSSLTIDRA